MPKFKTMPRSGKNPDGRRLAMFCENHPDCGSGIQGFWRPRKGINVDDPAALGDESARINGKMYHYCAKCEAARAAARPPGYDNSPSWEMAEKMADAAEALRRRRLLAG